MLADLLLSVSKITNLKNKNYFREFLPRGSGVVTRRPTVVQLQPHNEGINSLNLEYFNYASFYCNNHRHFSEYLISFISEKKNIYIYQAAQKKMI